MYDLVVGDLLAAQNPDDVREVGNKVWRAACVMAIGIALAYIYLFLRHIYLFLQKINPLNQDQSVMLFVVIFFVVTYIMEQRYRRYQVGGNRGVSRLLNQQTPH